MYGAAVAPSGEWTAYLGAFVPAAMLGLGVMFYLVRRLDASQADNKALAERLISMHEVTAPLLKDAIDMIAQQGELIEVQGELIREARAEARARDQVRDRDP